MTQSLCLAIWKLEFCSWATVLQTLKNILLASIAANSRCCSPFWADRRFTDKWHSFIPSVCKCHFIFRARLPWEVPCPGHFPDPLQMFGLAVPPLPEATVPSSTCSSQGITESTKLLGSLGSPLKIPLPDNPRPHSHATSCLFPHFPISTPTWSKHGKGSFTSLFAFSHSSLARIYGKTGVDKLCAWPSKFLHSLPGKEHTRERVVAFSCTSALTNPYCLSRYCRRGKEPGNSCQKLPMFLPCHCPSHWNRICQNSIQVLRWNRKVFFITELCRVMLSLEL